jgi:hypothetical protein
MTLCLAATNLWASKASDRTSSGVIFVGNKEAASCLLTNSLVSKTLQYYLMFLLLAL